MEFDLDKERREEESIDIVRTISAKRYIQE